MVWRRRRRAGEGGGHDERDEHLAFLTRGQADRVRGLVRTAFAERGREVTVFAGHVRDDQGRRYGLWNVAAMCHDDPGGEPAWPGIVAEHVRRLVAIDDFDGLEAVPAGEARARTYAKLVAPDFLPGPHPEGDAPLVREPFRYARESVPGLVELLAYDLSESVRYYRDEDIDRFGGVAVMRAAGLANLRALPIEERTDLSAPRGGRLTVVAGSSIYTASRVLDMPDLLARVFGTAEAPGGALVGLGNRHEIALHVIRDASVLASLEPLARFTAAGFSRAGPLSPHLYWWWRGSWERLSRPGPDGGLEVVIGPDLAGLIEGLGGR